MFGYTRIKNEDLQSLKDDVKRLDGEVKGYYSRGEMVNEYLEIIAPQLRGLELPKLASFTREDIKNAYETSAPVMGVVNYIADNIGEVSKYLELRDKATGEYITKHWLLDLLNRPNDRFTRRKLLTAWAINRNLFGDAFTYAPILPGKDRTIKEMYILSGQKVEIDRGGIEKPMKGIKYLSASNKEIEMDGKVFESFDYNLDDLSFFGTSKIAAAAIYLTVMERAMNRQAATLKNGGPTNIITPSASGNVAPLPSQVDDMEKKMNRIDNANKNISLRTAIEVHQLGDNPANLSVLSSHQDAINALCFVFKLPVDLYLGQAKYENAKEAKKTIYEQMAIPMCNEFAEDLLHYAKLDDKFTLEVNTDAIEVLKDKRIDTLINLEKMHASLNELREANGYEPIEEPYANQPILPMGVMFGNEGADFDISE